jgi:hypothetical protein
MRCWSVVPRGGSSHACNRLFKFQFLYLGLSDFPCNCYCTNLRPCTLFVSLLFSCLSCLLYSFLLVGMFAVSVCSTKEMTCMLPLSHSYPRSFVSRNPSSLKSQAFAHPPSFRKC